MATATTTGKCVTVGVTLAAGKSPSALILVSLTWATIGTRNIVALVKASRVHRTMALEGGRIVGDVASIARKIASVELIVADSVVIPVAIIAIEHSSSLFLFYIVAMVTVENWLK